MARRVFSAGMLVGVMLVAACTSPDILPPPHPITDAGPNDPGDAGEPAEPDWVRLELSPRGALLTPTTPTLVLTVVGVDARGLRGEISGGLTFESSAPEVVEVDEDGLATFAGTYGAAAVRARFGDLESPPIHLVGASPRTGAVLVEDAQVVDAPRLAPDDGTWDMGSRYLVTLRDLVPVPTVGDIVVGTGMAAVGGRVVGTTPSDDAIEVELEVVALDEMFDELELELDMPLSLSDAVFDESLARGRTLEWRDDGSLRFTPPKETWTTFSAPATPIGTAVLNPEANVGPFACDFQVQSPLRLDVGLGDVTVASDLRFVLEYSNANGELLRLAIAGTYEVKSKIRAALLAALEGSVDCRMRLFELPVPLPGAIAIVLGGYVPVGLGFQLEGQVTLADAGFELEEQVKNRVELGVYCPGGESCAPYAERESELELKPSFFATPPTGSGAELARLRLKPALSAYGWASFEIGPRFTPRPRAELLLAKAGLKQSADLALVLGQVVDPDYASAYKLALDVSIGTGAHVQQVLQRFRIAATPLALTYTDTLALSPQATQIVADSPFYDPGDPVSVVVDLSGHSRDYGWLADNVAEIAIVHGGTLPSGQPFYTVLASAPVAPEQEEVEVTFDASEPLVVDDLYAFVKTRVPLPEPFELLELGPAVWPHVTLLEAPVHLGDNAGTNPYGTEWVATFDVPADALGVRLIVELANSIDTTTPALTPGVAVNGTRIGINASHLLLGDHTLEECALSFAWPDLGPNCTATTWECEVLVDEDVTALVTPGAANEVRVSSVIDMSDRCPAQYRNWDDFDLVTAVVAFTE